MRFNRYFIAVAFCLLFVGEARAHVAWGIVLDGQGQVYFANVLHGGTVWKIDAQGRLSRFVTGKHSHGLVIDDQGNLYGEQIRYDNAVNRWTTILWKATPDGALTDFFNFAGETLVEDVLLFDASGNRYFWRGNVNVKGESQIVKLAPDGKTSVLAGGDWGHRDGLGQAAQFRKLGALAWGPDSGLASGQASGLGRSLFMTEGGGGAVRRITMDGTVTTLGGVPLAGVMHGAPDEATAASLMGLAVDEQGNVFVADHDHGCLRRIAPDGSISTLAASGWFWKPSGVAVQAGALYVLEHSLTTSDALGIFSALEVGPYLRVRRIAADGTATNLTTIWGNNSWLFAALIFGVGTLIGLALKRLKRRQRPHHQSR